ncbi:hypothetical protein BGX34_004703, partial [Mortierella sp. NVP85]
MPASNETQVPASNETQVPASVESQVPADQGSMQRNSSQADQSHDPVSEENAGTEFDANHETYRNEEPARKRLRPHYRTTTNTFTSCLGTFTSTVTETVYEESN